MHQEPCNPHIPHSTPVDTIIHLGAGRCSELEGYLASKPTHLLLVEADPQLTKTLQARTNDFPHVKIINKAVAGQPGSAMFYRYNLPDVSGLHQANSNLLKLFPGLKTVQTVQTEATAPSALLQPLELQADQHNWLTIDLPGEELAVLKAIQQADQLHLFDQLQLHCGNQALYEEGEPAATILQWLQDQGFDLFQEDNSHDLDRPCWMLKRNKLQLRHRQLKQQLTRLTQLTSDHDTQLNQQKTQIEQLTKARDEQVKLVAEHKEQLEKANQAKANQEKLANVRLTQIEQLTKARDEQAKLVAEHKEQLEKTNQTRANQEKLANDRLTQIEQLTKARDEQTKLVAEHKEQLEKANQTRANQEKLANDRLTQIEQLTKARDEQAKLVAEHKEQLEKANQTRAHQEKLANDRLIQLEQLTKASDEQAKLTAENKAQLDKANQAKAEQTQLATAHHQQRDQEKQRADNNQQQLAQKQEEVEKLEQQLGELNHRLPMLDTEFVKAEAQIELIKDILIREKAF